MDDGLVYRLIMRRHRIGDQIAEWRRGMTLPESGVSGGALLREKIYANGDHLEHTINRQGHLPRGKFEGSNATWLTAGQSGRSATNSRFIPLTFTARSKPALITE